jgi:hypothetical protein
MMSNMPMPARLSTAPKFGQEGDPERPHRQQLVTWLTLGFMLSIFAGAAMYSDRVAALRDGLRSLGPYGAVPFIALEAAWSMSTLPSAPLMTLGGLLSRRFALA